MGDGGEGGTGGLGGGGAAAGGEGGGSGGERVVVGATAVPVVPTVEMGMEAAMVATKAVLVAITVVAIREGMVVDIRVVLEVRLVAPEKVGD